MACPSKHNIAERLTEARARTLLLVAPLSADDIRRQHDPLMSPILWDLGHIAHFEELWLTRNLSGTIEFSEMPGMYNPLEHPRSTRATLPLPSLPGLLNVAADIRTDVLMVLEQTELQSGNPILHDGFVYNMVLQHEYQHNETILQTLQLKQGEPYRAPRIARPRLSHGSAVAMFSGMVRIESGDYPVGSDDRSTVYDNERPAHAAHLSSFDIDASPVTNEQYLAFMADGGYARAELWSPEGQVWLAESGAQAPKYWLRDGDSWLTRSMDITATVAPDHPVCHVCYYEADAFARWAGKRLPTEFEWEVAASWDPSSNSSRRFPWGGDPSAPLRANLDQLTFSTAPVGAYPDNVSPLGCYGMIGDVWEWTATDFHGYPDYRSFPYPEYSETSFGTQYKVLRGGSWATRPGAIRNSFRNWDFPIRRQIFSGFRCARDV
ncbi:MAG: ergothioneine biosynthesis protein EgtB [Gemmatimonadaceae bacterium]